ncbi:MAG: copper chaperone PCu(A)C [Magnetospiraceae bacterium]
MTFFKTITSAFILACMAALTAPGALAAETVTVSDSWSRASAGPARAGAAFMTITNTGAVDDQVVAAASDVAKRVELHTHKMDGGVMRMRQVPGIPVPAGGTADLKPGGFHVMLMGLNDPLVEGESFTVTLTFENAGEVTITVPILAPGSMGPK